jgi:hypothetical protein
MANSLCFLDLRQAAQPVRASAPAGTIPAVNEAEVSRELLEEQRVHILA